VDSRADGRLAVDDRSQSPALLAALGAGVIILARLRAHFDDPLFIRDGQSMNPTPKALEIAEPLRDMLIAADTLHTSTSSSFDPRTSDRVFKLLTADVGMACFFPHS
jgi:DNA-binding transcriptional LysR family regulator